MSRPPKLPPITATAKQVLDPVTQIATATVPPLHELIVILSRRSHASYVLLAATQIENALQELICSHLPKLSNEKRDKLFKGLGAFSHFSTKIEVANAMGEINGDTRHDLDVLREIRNEFAHPSKEIHFHLDEMSNLLRKFRNYDDKMDPLAFFWKKLDEIWAALNPQIQMAALLSALKKDVAARPDTSPKKSR